MDENLKTHDRQHAVSGPEHFSQIKACALLARDYHVSIYVDR